MSITMDYIRNSLSRFEFFFGIFHFSSQQMACMRLMECWGYIWHMSNELSFQALAAVTVYWVTKPSRSQKALLWPAQIFYLHAIVWNWRPLPSFYCMVQWCRELVDDTAVPQTILPGFWNYYFLCIYYLERDPLPDKKCIDLLLGVPNYSLESLNCGVCSTMVWNCCSVSAIAWNCWLEVSLAIKLNCLVM